MEPIEKRVLGRTGLTVSLLGLGAGGNSRLGLSTGKSIEHAAEVVRAAFDLGITLFDTARGYGTERAIGDGLKGRRRDQVVVSSKSTCVDKEGNLLSEQAFADNIDTSLHETGLDRIDVYYIHALRLDHYVEASARFVPVLEKARQAGKVRFLGVTEAFESDTRHEMLQRAVQDDHWDVMMVGFNLLNPTARERVLAYTLPKGIGVMGMFAVRRGLIDESLLRVVLERLAAAGMIDTQLAQAPNLLEALGLAGASSSLSEAAYRFAAYEPGMDCVLSGTSSAAHLEENLRSVRQGPLPQAARARLAELFSHVDSISGQVR